MRILMKTFAFRFWKGIVIDFLRFRPAGPLKIDFILVCHLVVYTHLSNKSFGRATGIFLQKQSPSIKHGWGKIQLNSVPETAPQPLQ